MVQPFLCVLVAGKALFLSSKRVGVVIAPAVNYASRMFDMQHFVKDNVFDEPLRNFAGIQDLTNRDRVMGGVMMTQNASSSPSRPGQHRLFDLTAKISAVEVWYNTVRIISLPPGPAD